MDQAQEVLLVVVLQIRVVVLQGQVLGDLPVSTTVVELVAVLCAASHGQAGGVRRGATRRMLQLTCVEGHVVDFFRSDGATVKGLWQQTAVVRDQDRQVGCQSATQVGLGLREARLDVGRRTAPFVYGRTIGVAWEKGVGIRMVPLAAVQVDTQQCLGVDTETDSALGETGQIIEFQAFCGLFLIRTAFTVIVVVIHGPGTDGRLAVFQETCCACLLRHYPYGHGQSQGGLVHCEAPLDSNSCIPGLESSPEILRCAISARP
ncbi:hypothetical protein D3C84_764710 [compost metagenome]